MSVFTRNTNKLFYHDRDLDCFVVRDEPVTLSELTNDTPSNYDEKLYNNLNKDIINGDFVDAYLSLPVGIYNEKYVYRCTIPAGMPFYISDNLKEVAAKKLVVNERITSQPIFKEVLVSGYVDCLRLDLFRDNIKDEIAYFVLLGGKVVNPYQYIGTGSDVVGVICNLHDNVAKVIAIEEKELEWSTLQPDKTRIVTKKQYKEKKVARQDLNGYQNTHAVTKSKNFKYENYPAIDYCLDYSNGDLGKGRWFLGSAGDVVSLARDNMLRINAALAILQYKGVDCDLLDCDWYWTSTEYHENSVWAVVVNSGFLGFNVKAKKGGVRPMTIINFVPS